MFRFETIVGIVIALGCSASFAADKNPFEGLGGDKCTRLGEYDKAKKLELAEEQFPNEFKKDKATALAMLSARYCATNSNDMAECSNANVEFKKAKEEFIKSCGPGGFQMSGSNDEWPGCAKTIEQCRKCASGSHAKNDTTDNVPCDPDTAGDGSSSYPDGSPRINTDRMQRQARYCPASVAKNQKDLNKKYDDARKEVKDLEKKLPEQMKRYTDAKNKAEDEAAQARDKVQKAQDELDQGLADAKKKLSEANQQLAAEIMQLEQQIAQVADQQRKVSLKKVEAEMQYNEAIQQIEINCHKSASQTVSKMQMERLSRPFNRGGFQSMLKQVGLSDRESWQRMAAKYFRYCMADEATKASKRSAKRTYDVVLQQANSEVDKLEQDKQRLIASEQKLKDRNCRPQLGAMPDADQSKACAQIEEAQSEAQRLNRKFANATSGADADVAKAMRKGQNEAQAAGAEAQMTSQQLADEKRRMHDLRRAYEIADEAAGKSSDDPKAHEEALSKYDKFKSQASTLVNCGKNKGAGCGSKDCRDMDKFLNNLGMGIADVNDVSSSIGTKDADPTPAPPRTPTAVAPSGAGSK